MTTCACRSNGLAIGIGLQNILKEQLTPIRDGSSRNEHFLGSMSAIVEPSGAVLGSALSSSCCRLFLMPCLRSWCDDFVVVEELIPESQTKKY